MRIPKTICIMLVLVLFINIFSPCAYAAPAVKPELKVFAIGNKQTESSLMMLRSIGETQGVTFTIGLMLREDLSLDKHYENYRNNKLYGSDDSGAGYYMQWNQQFPSGQGMGNRHHIYGELIKSDWDCVIFHDSTAKSGNAIGSSKSISSFIDSINEIDNLSCVKYFYQETWAFESSNATDRFAIYNYDQQVMYENIKTTTDNVKANVELNGIIRTGEAFELARNNGFTDSELIYTKDGRGGANDIGKLLSGLVMYMSLTGCEIKRDKLTMLTVGGLLTEEQINKLVDIALQAVLTDGVILSSFDEVFANSNNDTSSKSDVSSELIYNPNDHHDSDQPAIDPIVIVAVAAGIAVIGGLVATTVIIKKKKKNK